MEQYRATDGVVGNMLSHLQTVQQWALEILVRLTFLKHVIMIIPNVMTGIL